MNDSPLVCICIPTYNVASTVRETLLSILAQTYKNLVVHISDNASTDETLKVLEELNDPRIIIHRNEVNVGGEGNFTRCIKLATGKYTAIFHADDIYSQDMVAKQVAYLELYTDIGAVFTAASTIDEYGKKIGLIGIPPVASKTGAVRFDFKELLQAMLLHHNFLICPSVLVSTEIYKEHIKEWGSNKFLSSSDVDTWLRLSCKMPIAVLTEPLMSYRISTAQFSNSIRNRTERADFFLVMDDYLSRPDVLELLSKEDLRYYGWLVRHECVARSLNLFALGRAIEAKPLLRGFICRDSLNAALHSRRGLVTLVGGILLLALLLFGIENKSQTFIKHIKSISWK